MAIGHNLTRSSNEQKSQNESGNQNHWSLGSSSALFIANRRNLWHAASEKVARFVHRSSYTFHWDEKLGHGA